MGGIYNVILHADTLAPGRSETLTAIREFSPDLVVTSQAHADFCEANNLRFIILVTNELDPKFKVPSFVTMSSVLAELYESHFQFVRKESILRNVPGESGSSFCQKLCFE
ncbi:MAG: hypothetical protein K2X93_24085 [Candidatus Obscuribacterales bacterium]|nr:hypothetical protein [Candidatus Obscuribacterales bacterium]